MNLRSTKFKAAAICTKLTLFAGLLFLNEISWAQIGGTPESYDVVVYEGTPSGVMAAVAAARQGHTVGLIELNNHVGGVVSGGLCVTDIGNRATVGGLAADFFTRITKYYSDKYGANSKEVKSSRDGIVFEPHVAEEVFEQMLSEQHVTVWKAHRLHSITQDANGNVKTLTADDLVHGGTKTFTGKIFIDASYEGDLMAQAKVPYRYGREGKDEYNESLAGISVGPDRGKADNLIMSYNYRVSLTSTVANRVLIPKPDHYDPEPWRIIGKRIKDRNLTQFIQLFASGPGRASPNDKYDTNWFDFAGSSNGYVEGDWATRAIVAAKVRDFALSELYYLQNDPEIPAAFHDEMQNWGLPKDEFTDNGNFPFQFYVREARRMVGQYVLRESDITQDRYKPDGICGGSYGVDCHVIQELTVDGKKVVDHTPHTNVAGYDIPYACLTPQDKPGQPTNLLVPVCCSATHVAYCSVRMEPVYMMLGQAAGDAAHLALANSTSVQKVDVPQLRDVLRKEGAILDSNYQPVVKISWTPQHPKAGEQVQFKAETVEARDPLTKISWDFVGDGKVAAEGETAQTTFAIDKTYNVSLLVVDQTGRRKMMTAEVPVGAATAKDVTVDDFDYGVDLSPGWDGDPVWVDGTTRGLVDVFTGPAIHYQLTRRGEKQDVSAKFHAQLPRDGRYEVCFGYRPSAKQTTSVKLTVQSSEGACEKTIDETNSPTPFPWVPVGEFHFKAGGESYVQINSGDAEGRVVVDGIRWVWLGE